MRQSLGFVSARRVRVSFAQFARFTTLRGERQGLVRPAPDVQPIAIEQKSVIPEHSFSRTTGDCRERLGFDG